MTTHRRVRRTAHGRGRSWAWWTPAVLISCALLTVSGVAASGRPDDASVRTPRTPDGTERPAAGGTTRAKPSGSASPAPKATASAGPTASAAPSASASATTSPAATPVADPGFSHVVPVPRIAPQVGAVFDGSMNGEHYCTASVVDSPGGNLIVSAAHCLDDASTDVFVPGYHDGVAPYGVWQLSRIVADAQWSDNSDQDHDLAFAQVTPRDGHSIQSTVGSYALSTAGTTTGRATLIGYPTATDAPITCANDISAYGSGQLRIYCTGFTGGTSGSPWLTGAASDTVSGVIGGYERGGDTSDVSYSVVFGSNVKSLYDQAVSAGG